MDLFFENVFIAFWSCLGKGFCSICLGMSWWCISMILKCVPGGGRDGMKKQHGQPPLAYFGSTATAEVKQSELPTPCRHLLAAQKCVALQSACRNSLSLNGVRNGTSTVTWSPSISTHGLWEIESEWIWTLSWWMSSKAWCLLRHTLRGPWPWQTVLSLLLLWRVSWIFLLDITGREWTGNGRTHSVAE